MSIFEKLKGKAKEAAGSATGSDSLRREGQAQQLRADELAKATRARLRAKQHEDAARKYARTERFHQGT